MAASNNDKLRYGFVHVCLAGVFIGGPLIAVWLASNTPWKGARSVILGINGWSNLAGVIAGQLFKSEVSATLPDSIIWDDGNHDRGDNWVGGAESGVSNGEQEEGENCGGLE